MFLYIQITVFTVLIIPLPWWLFSLVVIGLSLSRLPYLRYLLYLYLDGCSLLLWLVFLCPDYRIYGIYYTSTLMTVLSCCNWSFFVQITVFTVFIILLPWWLFSLVVIGVYLSRLPHGTPTSLFVASTFTTDRINE